MNSAILVRAVITGIAMVASASAFAASKFEQVNLVKEGIDQKQAVVRANSGGYTSYETDKHTYYVRVFAKAKGSNSVFAAGIGSHPGMSLTEVSGSGKFFFSQRTPDDGWGVYKRSVTFTSKLSEMPWYVSPKKACEDNLKAQVAKGMTKAKVLSREWKVMASAVVHFYAGADTKSHIRNGKASGSGETRSDNIGYQVNVLCREAL
jgi:hypothetical protein